MKFYRKNNKSLQEKHKRHKNLRKISPRKYEILQKPTKNVIPHFKMIKFFF